MAIRGIPQQGPIAIGGIGGSGTRIVAAIFQHLGYDIGSDLNESNDNLAFTLLFKHRDILQVSFPDFRQLYDRFARHMATGAPVNLDETTVQRLLAADRAGQHQEYWLRERIHHLALGRPHASPAARGWAWKEPNTHIVLPHLLRAQPSLRYVHVMRNGLDMAFSQNQNQLHLWGEHVLRRKPDTPRRDSLSYWCAAHRRIFRIAADYPERVFILNYDALCGTRREATISDLLTSLGDEPGEEEVRDAAALIVRPRSIGRFRAEDRRMMLADDIAFVESLGFDVN